jgi:hypothetical protein
MKTLLSILLTVILFSACKKEDPAPTITGDWNIFFTFTSEPPSTYSGILIISQKDDNTLAGTFTINDNAGSSALLPSSQMTGNSIKFDIVLAPYIVNFQGSVNDSFSQMDGSFSSSGTELGTWTATRK